MRLLVLADTDDLHWRQGTGDVFNTYIARAQPRLFLHGHQHRTVETIVGQTRVVGVHGHAVIGVCE